MSMRINVRPRKIFVLYFSYAFMVGDSDHRVKSTIILMPLDAGLKKYGK